jgi:predicted esterase
MFPLETAYMARQQLTEVGADLSFREIEGLSHTFARSEIPDLLNWFDPRLGKKSASS